MNPEPQPSGHSDQTQSSAESCCGVPPQTVEGAPLARHSESEHSGSSAPNTGASASLPPLITAHRSLVTSSSLSFSDLVDMGFVDPPEIPAESSYDGDCGYEDKARDHELLLDDLADDNDDFARSDEEGWYYSDED